MFLARSEKYAISAFAVFTLALVALQYGFRSVSWHAHLVVAGIGFAAVVGICLVRILATQRRKRWLKVHGFPPTPIFYRLGAIRMSEFAYSSGALTAVAVGAILGYRFPESVVPWYLVPIAWLTLFKRVH